MAKEGKPLSWSLTKLLFWWMDDVRLRETPEAQMWLGVIHAAFQDALLEIAENALRDQELRRSDAMRWLHSAEFAGVCDLLTLSSDQVGRLIRENIRLCEHEAILNWETEWSIRT